MKPRLWTLLGVALGLLLAGMVIYLAFFAGRNS